MVVGFIIGGTIRQQVDACCHAFQMYVLKNKGEAVLALVVSGVVEGQHVVSLRGHDKFSGIGAYARICVFVNGCTSHFA